MPEILLKVKPRPLDRPNDGESNQTGFSHDERSDADHRPACLLSETHGVIHRFLTLKHRCYDAVGGTGAGLRSDRRYKRQLEAGLGSMVIPIYGKNAEGTTSLRF